MNQRHKTIRHNLLQAEYNVILGNVVRRPGFAGACISLDIIHDAMISLGYEIKRYNIIMSQRSANTKKQIVDFVGIV